NVVADGKAMWDVLRHMEPDIVILDLMLPGDSGLTLCRDLRARSETPVIMLTARGDETDRIVGLEMGADDYLPKPFNPRELLARDQVMDKLHGRPGEAFDRSIDVQVSRLRQRLNDDAKEPAIIKTLRQEGYMLTATVSFEKWTAV